MLLDTIIFFWEFIIINRFSAGDKVGSDQYIRHQIKTLTQHYHVPVQIHCYKWYEIYQAVTILALIKQQRILGWIWFFLSKNKYYIPYTNPKCNELCLLFFFWPSAHISTWFECIWVSNRTDFYNVRNGNEKLIEYLDGETLNVKFISVEAVIIFGYWVPFLY